MRRFGEADDPRRRILIQALTLGLFSATAPVGANAQSIFGTSPSKLPPGQSIYRLSGEVSVNDQPATLQTPINANDTVKTGRNSEVVFVVGGNSMLMRAESQMTLTPRDQKPESSFLVGALRLVQGAILSVSRNNGMQVRTPAATIGIRGTGFYLESDPERSYFCTCYGLTDTTSNADPNDKATVQATHHDRPLYILANAPDGKTIRNAPFINHTDQELSLIETLVGRTPPWVFPGDLYNAPRRDY
jgi:hypothetical protein